MKIDHAALRQLAERLPADAEPVWGTETILALLDDYDRLHEAFRSRNEMIRHLEQQIQVVCAVGHELQRHATPEVARAASTAGWDALQAR